MIVLGGKRQGGDGGLEWWAIAFQGERCLSGPIALLGRALFSEGR